MLKIFSTLFAFGFVFTVPLSAATAETKTAPETDGCLIDTDNDGIVDKVIAVRTDGEAREAISGKLWKQNRKAVFEFKLPEVDKPVKKATLKLFLNGKFGCHPDKEGASGPETDLYYYLSPEADGKIELVDDNGVKLGSALPGKPVESVRKAITIDVTGAVQEAAAAKSPWIGFRLEAAPSAADGTGWRWRTAEFAEANGKQFCPTLTVVTE